MGTTILYQMIGIRRILIVFILIDQATFEQFDPVVSYQYCVIPSRTLALAKFVHATTDTFFCDKVTKTMPTGIGACAPVIKGDTILECATTFTHPHIFVQAHLFQVISELWHCGFAHTNYGHFFTVYHSDCYARQLATQKAGTEPARCATTYNNYSFDFHPVFNP